MENHKFFLFHCKRSAFLLLSQNELKNIILKDSDNLLLSFPDDIVKSWLRNLGNGYITVQNNMLFFQINPCPNLKSFNVFEIANIFHENEKIHHFNAVSLMLNELSFQHDFNMTHKMEPQKNFRISPNFIFQIPSSNYVGKITLDNQNLCWIRL